MRFGYRSDIGKCRENNEDSFFVDEKMGLFIIADGMGGHNGGEVASKLAVQTTDSFIRERIDTLRTDDEVCHLLSEAIKVANGRIFEAGEQDVSLRGMGATLSIVLCCGKKAHISHIGDSRIYLIRNRKILQLTKDHSIVAELIREGRLSPEKAKTHHLRNMLSQVVGVSYQLTPDNFSIDMESGDYLLLCSDGLTNMVREDEILSIVQNERNSLFHCCNELVDLANNNGGADNITVIVVQQNNTEKRGQKKW